MGQTVFFAECPSPSSPPGALCHCTPSCQDTEFLTGLLDVADECLGSPPACVVQDTAAAPAAASAALVAKYGTHKQPPLAIGCHEHAAQLLAKDIYKLHLPLADDIGRIHTAHVVLRKSKRLRGMVYNKLKPGSLPKLRRARFNAQHKVVPTSRFLKKSHDDMLFLSKQPLWLALVRTMSRARQNSLRLWSEKTLTRYQHFIHGLALLSQTLVVARLPQVLKQSVLKIQPSIQLGPSEKHRLDRGQVLTQSVLKTQPRLSIGLHLKKKPRAESKWFRHSVLKTQPRKRSSLDVWKIVFPCVGGGACMESVHKVTHWIPSQCRLRIARQERNL